MNKNKTGAYLKYAIGEIALVVIGILIALQINTWNEATKLKKLEISYYQNILVDLQKDSTEYNYKKINAERNMAKLKNILNFIQQDYDIEKTEISEVRWSKHVFKDTMALWISFSQAGFVQFPHIFENTITDLRVTGNIKLLGNEALKNQLVDYYNFQKVFDDWNESYLPNRTEIDLVINNILPLNARMAYNEHDDELMYELLSDFDGYDDFLLAIKREEDLEPLVNGMYHIQTRIKSQCISRASNLEKVKQTVINEIKNLESN